MKVFTNKTTLGNEKAIKRGVTVPDDAVNLAYAKAPELSPVNNIIIIDSSGLAQSQPLPMAGLYYANTIGILEDINGNQLIKDQYPIISDTFTFNPNQNVFPGSKYTPAGILPFVHVSRYFHLDFISVAIGDILAEYSTPYIKVIDGNGNEYVDSNGAPRFKIKVVPAKGVNAQSSKIQSAFRVYAYVDTNVNKDLYLAYNKVELDDEGNLQNPNQGWQEILNPASFFEYRPEESEVIDLANRNQKWFASRPVSVKTQLAGGNVPNIDGYKVFVPKKAIGDTRLFQLFRWRVNCAFDVTTKVDQSVPVRAGIVVTDADPISQSSYAFYNLAQSSFNSNGISFVNPLASVLNASQYPDPQTPPYATGTTAASNVINYQPLFGQATTDPSVASYWYVNADQASLSDLDKFDILIWSPNKTTFDFTQYQNFISYFTETLGHTLIIDSNNFCEFTGLPGVTVTAPVNPQTNQLLNNDTSTAQGTNGSAVVNTATLFTPGDPLFNEAAQSTNGWHGWDIANVNNMSYIQNLYGNQACFCQAISQIPSDWTVLIQAQNPAAAPVPITVGVPVPPPPPPPPFIPPPTTTNQSVTSAGEGGGGNVQVSIPSLPFGASFQSINVNGTIQGGPPLSGLTVTLTGSGQVQTFGVSNTFDFTNPAGPTYQCLVTVTDPSLCGGTAYLNTIYNGDFSDLEITLNYSITVAGKLDAGEFDSQPLGDIFSQSSTSTSTSVFVDTSGSTTATVDPTTLIPAGATLTGVTVNGAVDTIGAPGQSQITITQGSLYSIGIGSTNETGATELDSFSSNPITISTFGNITGGGGATISVTYTMPSNNYIPTYYGPIYYAPVPLPPPISYTDLVVAKDYASGGRLIVSTFGLTQTVSALYNPSPSLVDDNTLPQAYAISNYNDFVGTPITAGAYQFLFNSVLLACKERSMDDIESFSSSYKFSSPWQATWTIDSSVLSQDEKTQYQFAFVPLSVANPTLAWQRQISTNTLQQITDASLNPVQRQLIAGAVRTYSIDCTNPLVQITPDLSDSSIPYAHTTAYSPPFVIPTTFGPYIIKEDSVLGNYDQSLKANFTVYPPKPYKCQIVVGDQNNLGLLSESTDWTASGLAAVPIADNSLTWANSGQKLGFETGQSGAWNSVSIPAAISTWSSLQLIHSAWPHFAMPTKQLGSTVGSDPVIQFLQDALILFMNLGYFPSQALSITGVLDAATISAVQNFRNQFTTASLYDESDTIGPMTWSLIGAQIIRANQHYTPGDPNYKRYYDLPWQSMQLQNLSDGDLTTYFSEVGNIALIGSAGNISYSPCSDYIFMQLDQTYSITGFKLTSFGSLTITSANVTQVSAMYDSNTSQSFDVGESLSIDCTDGIAQTVTFAAPIQGNMLIVGVKSNTLDSPQTFGIREIAVMQPASNQAPINVGAVGQAALDLGQSITVSALSGFDNTQSYTAVTWQSVSFSNRFMTGSITSDGTINITYSTASNVVNGPLIPGGTYYSKTPSGSVSPVLETGWVSKADGIKLLCNSDGTPYGFPSLASSNDAAYVNVKMESQGSDPSVIGGFYDLANQEFLTDNNGNPSISYAEYVSRNGPSNVFVGVMSNYQTTEVDVIPITTPAPMPYRWAYPIYGVLQNNSSAISLEPLSPNLGNQDIWPINIKAGHFDKTYAIRPRSQGVIGGILSTYQGRQVTAHYSIPEAYNGPWSLIYGPPQMDVIGETPIIITDQNIRVRQTPIFALTQPTQNPSFADPYRPIFTVYTRTTINDSWVAIPRNQISDYNLITGDIYLYNPLSSLTKDLVKVDYVSKRVSYAYKGTSNNPFDLNPYLQGEPFNQAIYAYLVPEYMIGPADEIVPGSFQTSTIRTTLNPDIFDPVKPAYDPTALLLGEIFIAPSANLNDLILIDSRRRGGGAKDQFNYTQLTSATPESSTYWDIDNRNSTAYNNAGFVIIRLPVALKSTFSEQEIKTIIDLNITAGVGYELQDLEGNAWGNIDV